MNHKETKIAHPPLRNKGGQTAARLAVIVLAVVAAAVPPLARAVDAPSHNISAGNLNVVQNDSQNTEASVTVTMPLSINDMRVRIGSNRGDYNLQVGDTGTNDLKEGLVMTAVSQNGRYNLDEASEPIYGASAFDGGANGYWAVLQDVTSDRAEYNVNCAVAYFRYTNWLAGWARNKTAINGGTNDLFTSSPGILLGNQFKGISSGRSRVNLTGMGISSLTDGVLIVNHAKNEGNFALSVANSDGTWELYVKDNFGTTTNPKALEQDPVAFVFIPKTNTTVVSGKFGLDSTGTNAVVLLHSGTTDSFAVTNIAAGRYRLTIPGALPAFGVLITSAEGGYASNFDNIINYEADGDGWIIESRDTGVYPPVLEACTNEPVASFVFIPSARPGFSVSPTNGLITTEFGVTASFTVALDFPPTNDVTINVSSSNPTEGFVSTGFLSFSTTNWNIPQTVTITGQDDTVADGPVSYNIVLAPAISEDVNYSGLDPADVSVINVDDEQRGISITPTSGLVTSEAGSSATFAVFLNHQPTADVVIGLSSDNLAEGTVSPASLTFTPGDWSTPKTVTVTGVDDFKQDGDKAYTIVTASAVSADLNYNGVKPANVSVVNRDNDVAGYVWNYTSPVTVIEGAKATYSLMLATQPDSNVVIQVTSSNPSVGTVSPATLTFTSSDWRTPKIITVTGVDNLIANPTATFNITHQPVTTDPVYSQLVSAITLSAIVIDNEAQLSLPSGDCIYGVGMPAIGIDGQASLTDADATSYNNGILTVALTNNANVADQLEIRNSGQITTNGGKVSYEGAAIGSFTGGSGTTPLVVSLNSSATVSAVQQLLRSITFRTATNGASLRTRTATVSFDDGFGVVVSGVKQIRVGAVRQTQYQEGGDYGYGQYFGAADIALSQVGSSTPWPAGRTPAPQEGLLIDWPDGGTPNESQVLLRFDDFVGTNYWQVPSNAIVVSAELLIKVNNTGDGGTFHRMLIPWDAMSETWNSIGGGIWPDDVKARVAYDSQLGVEDGSGATGTGIISVGVTPDIQAWVNGQTNFGWVIVGWPFNTDGTGFSPSEVATVGDRPRLRVQWLLPEYPQASFKQGVDGYASTHDTNLRQALPDLNYATEDTLWSDANDAGNTNNTQCLLRFDNIIGAATNQIPPGSQIHAAFLDLSNTGADAMGDGGQLYTVLQPWNDTNSTWNSWVNGIQPDGIEAAITPTVVAGNSGLDPDVQGSVNSFNVTADVQAWSDGARPNYGWAILPWPGGSNGWGIRSSKYFSWVDEAHPEREHPRLRVYYTASVAAVPAVIFPLSVSRTQIQIRFTGTMGLSYTVLRAPSVDGTWTSIGTATVETSGEASFVDASPLSGEAFYRIVYQ